MRRVCPGDPLTRLPSITIRMTVQNKAGAGVRQALGAYPAPSDIIAAVLAALRIDVRVVGVSINRAALGLVLLMSFTESLEALQ